MKTLLTFLLSTSLLFSFDEYLGYRQMSSDKLEKIHFYCIADYVYFRRDSESLQPLLRNIATSKESESLNMVIYPCSYFKKYKALSFGLKR